MKVEINHLTKVIQGNVVLDDINACFSCASGENGGRIYGIQGINGSGKTMLMRVICGLVLPTMGTVDVYKRQVYHSCQIACKARG